MVNSGPAQNRNRRVRYRNRRSRSSFLASAAFHGTILGFVALGPRPAAPPKRPIYDTYIHPNEKKIIWYRKFPEVKPAVKIGDSPVPTGAIKSPSTLIASSPKPKSSQQLILQPAPQLQLDRDLPAPNLIGVKPSMPPPPPPKLVKKFVAPQLPPKTPDAPVLMEPDVTVTWTDNGGVARAVTALRPKRAFVAPPQADAPKSRLVLETAPELGSGGATQTAKVPGLGGMPKLPGKRFTPPPSGSPDGKGTAGGGGGTGVGLDIPPELATTSNMNAVIVGLRPSDKIEGALPRGERPGAFSAAPNVGKPSSGNVNGGNGVTIPGLAVRDGSGKAPAGAATTASSGGPGNRTVLYDDVISGSSRPALSAPLRPSSRTIPGALEGRFRCRYVYTIAIPGPNLPAYTGDWIIWFAETTQKPGDAPRMRAPVPLQKLEPADARPAPPNNPELRVQLAAVIKANGKFESITPVRGPAAAVARAIEDLKRWDFRPALRDGAPIDVEVVIEIPFSLAWLSGAS